MTPPSACLPRRRRGLAGLGLGLALAAAGAAPARAAPPPSTPDWVVRELTITARAPGPVLWKVTRGDSTVWIVGALPWMPRDQAWSHGRLERVVAGANVVLTRPVATADLFTALGLLTKLGLPRGQTLGGQLDPDLAARYAQARAQAGTPAGRYDHDKAVVAAWKLVQDYQHKARLDHDEPQTTLVRLAHAHHVPVRPIARYPAKTLLNNLLALPPAEGRACLADAVADIAFADAHARPAARAWAMGDLTAVRAHYAEPQLAKCLEQAPSYTALVDRSVADTVAAVDAALARPGKSVAIFPLDALLRREGALERLRAQPGVTITSPDM